MPVYDVALFGLRVDEAGEDGPDQDAEWVLNFFADPFPSRGTTEFATFVDNTLHDLTLFEPEPSNPALLVNVKLFLGPFDPNDPTSFGPVAIPGGGSLQHFELTPILPIRTVVDTGKEPLAIQIAGHELDEVSGAVQSQLPLATIVIDQPAGVNENTYTVTALEAIDPNSPFFRYVAVLQITPSSAVEITPHPSVVFGPEVSDSGGMDSNSGETSPSGLTGALPSSDFAFV